tara:strand:+ start:3183 stop:3818 length:636 start_codon:yes stop_codon:yes gene_type:complete
MDKKISPFDALISELEFGLEILLNDNSKKIEQSKIKTDQKLTADEIKKSIQNIRVNHVGEVCAQGLYRGQAYFTKDKDIQKKLYSMCAEEENHLKLFNLRLKELKGHQSLLNPIWYTASFFLGAYAGINEKSWKMGFVEETEKQVKKHLDEYISLLPKKDTRSIAILKDVAKDEEKHCQTAQSLGSVELPESTKLMMDNFSRIMKKISYYF